MLLDHGRMVVIGRWWLPLLVVAGFVFRYSDWRLECYQGHQGRRQSITIECSLFNRTLMNIVPAMRILVAPFHYYDFTVAAGTTQEGGRSHANPQEASPLLGGWGGGISSVAVSSACTLGGEEQQRHHQQR